MRWRWLIWDFVDPGLEISRTERIAIWRAAIRGMRDREPLRWRGWRRTDRRWWLAMTQAMVPAAFTLPYIVWIPFSGSNWLTTLLALPVFLLLQMIGSFAVMGLIAGFICRDAVNAELAQRGYPVCAQCGYRLEGLTEQTACPECGRDRPERASG